MKYTEKNKVSIIMATYNRAHLLRQTIENIFKQDYKVIELIVVNDGSTDGTEQLLEQLKSDYEITIIHNTQNLGLQKSLNIGLKKATGKYIARIDDHDEWIDKGKLSKQVRFLEQYPEVGLLGTAYTSGEKTMFNPQTDQAIRKQILLRCPFCHVTIMMRRAVLEKVGGYNETLPYSEDWDLWLWMGRYTKMANLPDVTTAIINTDNSLSGNYFLRQHPINRKIINKHMNDYPNQWKAIGYHRFIDLFFKIIPQNGIIHKAMKRIFYRTFLSGK